MVFVEWCLEWWGRTGRYGDPDLPDGPEKFRDAYRQIIQITREEGADNITWVFHIDADDVPQEDWNRFENYYPGNEWIDWLGISVYGAGAPTDDECTSFRESMDATIPRIEALSADKPIVVLEFATAAYNPNCSQTEWTRAALSGLSSQRWPRVIGFAWWNENWQNDENPDHDTIMRIEDSPGLPEVFQELVGAQENVLGSIEWVGTAAPDVTPSPSDEQAPISRGAGPQYPFPQHVVYGSGTITPDRVRQEDQDRAVEEAYVAWKNTYLKDDCGPGLFYVWTQNATGGDDRSISTSEGHGYGMIIMALMAGYDPEAQTVFDGLYRFFRDHPSVNSQDLMAWLQTEDCQDLEPGNTSSAVDGDMDIAYALLLADRQWGSAGTINYRAEAIHVIDAIVAHEIHPETSLIMLGDWVTSDEPLYYFGTRSSDFMPGHLRAFYEATGDIVWLDALDNSYALYEDIQAQYSPETGLLPDFVQDTQTDPRPADPYYLEDKTDGWYYYNACRTPWRIGVDVLLSGDPRGKVILEHMNSWLLRATNGDPSMIYAGYERRRKHWQGL